jgi:hypothetical protein
MFYPSETQCAAARGGGVCVSENEGPAKLCIRKRGTAPRDAIPRFRYTKCSENEGAAQSAAQRVLCCANVHERCANEGILLRSVSIVGSLNGSGGSAKIAVQAG